MNNYNRFIQLILDSLNNVSQTYFQTAFDNFYALQPYLGQLGQFQNEIFLRHSERGFAYELYHQLRILIDNERLNNNNFFVDHLLQGEIKKMNVPEVMQHFGYHPLDTAYTPDLLFHIPAYDENAFVIEIKAQPNLNANNIRYDLDKLAQFLNRLHYTKAVFIAVNVHHEDVVENIINISQDIIDSFSNNNPNNLYKLSNCNIIVKQNASTDSPIFNQTLSQILA